MAGNVGGVKLDTARLDQLAARLDTNVSNALRRVAVQAHARAANLAPYDTGNLSNTMRMDQENELIYVVYDQTEYGIWQELGTSRMPAQPFMVPAIEEGYRDISRIIAGEVFNR